MSLLTELFGPDILLKSLDQVKGEIAGLPDTLHEKRAILLKEYASIKGLILKGSDYDDIM